MSPVDPVPDFVPVLGYVDDLVLVPAGVWLSRRLTPDAVLSDARARAREGPVADGPLGWVVAALVLLDYAGVVALAVIAVRPHV